MTARAIACLMVRHDQKSIRPLQDLPSPLATLSNPRVTLPTHPPKHHVTQPPRPPRHHAPPLRDPSHSPPAPLQEARGNTLHHFPTPHSTHPILSVHPSIHAKAPTPMVRHDNNTPSRAPSRKPNPTCPPDPTPLIASASKTELAALLRQLCAESRRARRAVEEALRPRAGTTSAGRKAGGRKRRRAEEGEEGDLGREDAAAGVEEEEEDSSAPASKRTAVCRNCGAGYVSSGGGRGGDGGVCVYHPGKVIRCSSRRASGC